MSKLFHIGCLGNDTVIPGKCTKVGACQITSIQLFYILICMD